MPTTQRAPARRRARAASASVLPVVTTSSTSQIRGGSGPRARKAPRTFRRRAARPCPVWLGVSRTRSRRWAARRSFSRAAIAAASSLAGLKPRARRRRGWFGTGTTSSGGGPGARAAAARASARTSAQAPGSSPARPARGYLKRRIQPSIGAWKSTAATRASRPRGARSPSGAHGSEAAQPAHRPATPEPSGPAHAGQAGGSRRSSRPRSSSRNAWSTRGTADPARIAGPMERPGGPALDRWVEPLSFGAIRVADARSPLQGG